MLVLKAVSTIRRYCMLVLKAVSKQYEVGGEIVYALSDFSYNFENGSINVVSGPSGSGKTTLLRLLGALEEPTSGEILLDNKSITHLKDRDASLFRFRDVGFIFQSYQLVAGLNVFDNVMLGATVGGKIPGVNEKELKDRALQLIDDIGLRDRIKHKPSELSGGQQQRVAIARALVKNPKIILADEPTANLDSTNAKKTIELLKNMNIINNSICIVATHDPQIYEMIDNKINLHDGRLINGYK